MQLAGATKLWMKRLAENDNSKNQVYLGPNLIALNVLPNGPLSSSPDKPALLTSSLDFSWLLADGRTVSAPGAQLILYPQYPEVRFSGFLRGCAHPPSDLMRVREAGRFLFFGITQAGKILGLVTSPSSVLGKEMEALALHPSEGVFSSISLDETKDDRTVLVSALKRIVEKEWIGSKRLHKDGTLLLCNAPHCGGYTLEAELGISANGYSEPDFHGWEIKQHAVPRLSNPSGGGPITLMTPEPTGGVYAVDGVHEFMKLYGYDAKTEQGRRNFGGIHTALKLCSSTGLHLKLDGYDRQKSSITDFSRGITLFDEKGDAAAIWHYKDLLSHWNRKHALAAYVPSNVRDFPERQYRYGNVVRLGEGTEFKYFLNAVANGAVYYDPAVKIVTIGDGKPAVKKRNQFRIKSSAIPQLYSKMTEVDVTS